MSVKTKLGELAHLMRRVFRGGTLFGPFGGHVEVPSDAPRQQLRAALRTNAFLEVTQKYDIPRRARRRLARALAKRWFHEFRARQI